jgi:hypothetical protein
MVFCLRPNFLCNSAKPPINKFFHILQTKSCSTPQGRIQDFKLGGGALKKIAPSGGRREKCWGISCEKSRFYDKKIIFFPIAGGGAKICCGISCEKSRFEETVNLFICDFKESRKRGGQTFVEEQKSQLLRWL